MEEAAWEGWAGGWPVGPKALAAQQVTEGLQVGAAGEDLGNSTSRGGVSWCGRTLHAPGLFPWPSVSPGASLRVLRHFLSKATHLLVLRP